MTHHPMICTKIKNIVYYFPSKIQADQMNKLVWRVRVITESFRPFVTNSWAFDTRNLRAIFKALPEDERFYCYLSFVFLLAFGFGF